MTEDAGYAIHSHTLEKVLTYVMQQQIFNRGRPVHISQRWAAQMNKMSTRTWRRACRWLVVHELIYRSTRRGSGPGSLFAVKWERVHMWMFSYSNNGQKKGSRAVSKRHLWPAGEYVNGFAQGEMRTALRIEHMAKMNPIPPKGGSKAAPTGARLPEEGGRPAAGQTLTVNGRILENVRLSPNLFETVAEDREFFATALDRGMVRWSDANLPSAQPEGSFEALEAASHVVNAILGLTADEKKRRYLEATNSGKEA
jgi:hypothetical protein